MSITIVSENAVQSQQVDSRVEVLHDTIISLLQEYDRTGKAVDAVTTRCPCPGHRNDDIHPSLDVSIARVVDKRGRESFRLSFRCAASKRHTPQDILKAVGEDFFLRLFSEWKGIPVDALKSAGVRVEADRKSVFYVFRYVAFDLKTPAGERYRCIPRAFFFTKGTKSGKSVFYPSAGKPQNESYLILCEGETDALALSHCGFHVAGIAGKGVLFSGKTVAALGKWFKRLYIVVEPDAEEDARELGVDGSAEVYLIHMKDTGFKDPCEMLAALGQDEFAKRWQQMMDGAERVEPSASTAEEKKPAIDDATANDVLQFVVQTAQTAPDQMEKVLQTAVEALKTMRGQKKKDTPNHVDVAKQLMSHYRFERFGSDLYWYDEQNGVWRNDARDWIASNIHLENIIADETKRRSFVGEVIAHIEAVSWQKDYKTMPEPPLTLIPFRNGVLDLQTGTLRDYRPEDYFTSKLPWRYDPNAQSTLLKKRLEAHPEHIRRHFMELLAYMLWRSYPYQRFFIWTGEGRNGKSYLVGMLTRAIGSENIASETMHALNENRFSPANLYRKLANIAGEVSARDLTSTDTLKRLTGGDTFSADRKFKDPIVFRNYAKCLFLLNSLPPTVDKTDAFYRRTFIMEFKSRFIEDPAIENELEQLSYDDADREFSWLLTQAVETLKELIANRFVFTGETSIEEKREKYERLSNPLIQFLEERTIRTYELEDYIPKFELLRELNEYLKERNLNPYTEERLNKAMREMGFEDFKKEVAPGKKWWCWRSIRWKTAEETGDGFSQVTGSRTRNSSNSNGLQPIAREESSENTISQFETIGVCGVTGPQNPSPTQNPSPDLDPFASDPALFIQECCVVEPEAFHHAGDLYEAYDRWSSRRGETAMTSTAFGRWLSEHGFVSDRGGQGIRIRRGLRLRDDLDLFDDEMTAIEKIQAILKNTAPEDLHRVLDDLMKKPVVKALVGRVLQWEASRVEYQPDAKELLSRFVDDLQQHAQWQKMKTEHIARFIVSLFIGRGLEIVGQNGDSLVLGARLKDDLVLQPEQPKKRSKKQHVSPEQELENIDYTIHETEGEPIVMKQDTIFYIAGKTQVHDIPEPTYPDIPDADIPDAQPWSDVKRVVIDIETIGLDPDAPDARIRAIGWKDTWREHIWMGDDEKLILQKFIAALEKEKPEVLAGHNIMEFDLPYIIARCEHHGIQHPFTMGKHQMTVRNTRGTLHSDRDIEFTPIFMNGTAIVDTLHLACRYDFSARVLSGYDLKTAARELCGREREVTLEKDNIMRAYDEDEATFRQYVLDDLRDTWALLEALAPAYHYIAHITNYPYWRVWTAGNASIWEHLLEQAYGLGREEAQQMADEKSKYPGGLVVSRTGVYKGCIKIDVSSLYPSIMLHYGVCSKKDAVMVSLAYLKKMTEMRLELKARAKQGDAEADRLQSAFKILINSLYGFLGTAGVGFNDMDAAEQVTTIGRALLSRMLHDLERHGCVIVEADTDGIIVQGDEKALEIAQSVLPQGFKLELEWSGKHVYVAGRKNYVVFNSDGSIHVRKGGVYRSRDRSLLMKDCTLEFIRKLVFEGGEQAKQYARDILKQIETGQAWELVVERRRLSEKNKNNRLEQQAITRGFSYGDKVEIAYASDGYSFGPADGYDVERYAKEWVKTIRDILHDINNPKVEATNTGKDGDTQ